MASESPNPSVSTPQGFETPPDGQTKKKAGPHSGIQTRAKRNRYISIACNECKRRKIKCNGQVPCQRCGHLNLECLYAPNCCNGNFKDSDEFRSMKEQINTLQSQVNSLFTKINELSVYKASTSSESIPFDSYSTTENSRSAPIPASQEQTSPPSPPQPRQPRFSGPASSAFNFGVAQVSLRHMGLTSNENPIHGKLTLDADEPSQPAAPTGAPGGLHPSKDPIWSVTREEAVRLCQVYEDEIGQMYPFFDIEKVIRQTNLLYNFLEAAARTGLTQTQLPGLDGLLDDDSLNLKMILATTLVLEGGGQSTLARQLYESVKPVFYSKTLEPATIKSIQLFSIVTMYHFHTDNELMCYRVVGMNARACFELGLHRWDAVIKDYPVEKDWKDVIQLFWANYNLDRRFSFGTGLPFSIPDSDIDPNLPEPDDSRPYSKSMVAYDRLGSKIWYSGLGYGGSANVNREEIGFLDYQVCQWYKNVPESVKLSVDSPGNDGSVNRSFQRLRVLLYLRMNHLRILIYRPVLHSASGIMENQGHARTVVDIARETIRVLARLNQTSDIYRTQQITFNWFLVAALAVLFLAVCHAPNEFSRQVRDEFYLALDLVNGFSAHTNISMRLWNSIKGLRKIIEKLGVFSRNSGTESRDPHSNAAVAMAGLAGHPIENISIYGQPLGAISELASTPMNGLQISHELTNLFEAVGSYNSFGSDSLNGFMPNDGDLQNPGEALAGVLSNDVEFSRILSGLI